MRENGEESFAKGHGKSSLVDVGIRALGKKNQLRTFHGNFILDTEISYCETIWTTD